MKRKPKEKESDIETPSRGEESMESSYPGKVPNPFVTTITHSVSLFSFVFYEIKLTTFLVFGKVVQVDSKRKEMRERWQKII